MRFAWIWAATAGCAFHPGAAFDGGGGGGGGGGGDVRVSDTAADSSSDTMAMAGPFCPTDPHLRLCFSFDHMPLPSPLPNEGAATVDAQLTNVTQISGATGGHAVQLDNTSEILVATTTQVTSIHTVELWFRVDTDPAAGSRYGLIDPAGPPNLDMFYYANATSPLRQIRCGIGSPDDLYTPELPAAGAWLYVVCMCDATGTTSMYVNGSKVVSMAEACTGGDIGPYGMTIGQNNNGTTVDSWLLGAFDGIRMWDQPLDPTTICATSGHASCP